QASTHAAGGHDRARGPSGSQAGALPRPGPGVAPRELRAQAPAPRPRQQARVVTSSAGHEPAPTPRQLDKAEVQPLPPGELQVQRDLSTARLAAGSDRTRNLYATRLTPESVSAGTRAYARARSP